MKGAGAGAGERGWLDAAFSSRRQIGKGRGLKIDTFICIGPMSAVFQVLTGVSNDCFTLQAKLFFVEKEILKSVGFENFMKTGMRKVLTFVKL